MKKTNEKKYFKFVFNFAWFTKVIVASVGSIWIFVIALALILLWLGTGPFFNFSNTWQLVINTGTSVITFLIVFLIQHTQNRDTEILNLKLDELIRIHKQANISYFDLDQLSDDELKALKEKYNKLCRKRASKSDHIKEEIIMPRGDKSSYTEKQKRQARHIEESYEKNGVSEKEAERRAWATVNKETGGGKKSGKGREKK